VSVDLFISCLNAWTNWGVGVSIDEKGKGMAEQPFSDN
jgi:hypothetical protein